MGPAGASGRRRLRLPLHGGCALLCAIMRGTVVKMEERRKGDENKIKSLKR